MGENETRHTETLEDVKEMLELYRLEEQYIEHKEFSLDDILKEYEQQKKQAPDEATFEDQPLVIEKPDTAEEAARSDVSPEEPEPEPVGPAEISEQPPADDAEPSAEDYYGQFEKVDFSSKLDELYAQPGEEEREEKKEGLLGRLFHRKSPAQASMGDDGAYADENMSRDAVIEEYVAAEVPAEVPADEADDYDGLTSELYDRKRHHFIRFYIGLAAELLLLGLMIGRHFGINLFQNYGVNLMDILSLALFVCILAVSYEEIGKGLLNLVKFEMNYESLCSFSALLCLVHGAAQISKGTDFVFYGSVAGLNLLCLVLVKAKYASFHLDSIRRLDGGQSIEQLCLVEDKQIIENLKKLYDMEQQPDWQPCLVRRVREELTHNSRRYMQREEKVLQESRKAAPVLFISIIVATGLVVFFTKDHQQILTILCVFSVASTPFIGFFSSLLPTLRARRKAPESIIISNDASETFSDCDGMVFTDRDLFPAGRTYLNNIKICGECEIDRIIRDTASILSLYDMAISEVFLDILKSDKSGIHDVEPIGNFAGEGVHAMSCGRRISIGTLDFMRRCGVVNAAYKPKETPGGNKNAMDLYVAQDGNLACVFSIVYMTDTNMKAELLELERRGVHIVLNTFDPNITPQYLKTRYGLSEESVLAVENPAIPGRIVTKSSSGVYTRNGGLFSFVETIDACRRIKPKESVNILIGFLSSGVSMVLFLALMSLNAIDQASPVNILLYFAMCVIPVSINQAI